MVLNTGLLRSKHRNIFCKSLFKNKFGKSNKSNNFTKLTRCRNDNSSLYYKPVGVWHLKRLSKFLKRSINLWSKDQIIYTFGKYSENLKINVEYVANHLTNDKECFGHFTLKGKKEPYTNDIKYPNNCLFDVLASKTGVCPNALRRVVIKEERKKWKAKLLKRRLSTAKQFPITLAIRGGARYNGKTQKQAKKILDSSQKGESHPNRQPGHPRGHASCEEATGPTASVENYSKGGWKTGFLTRSDQDFVAHAMLKTSAAQDAMDVLNELRVRANKEAVTIRSKDLPVADEDIPNAQEWVDGKRKGEPSRMRDAVIVMKHFYEKYNADRADVFVLTLYPKL